MLRLPLQFVFFWLCYLSGNWLSAITVVQLLDYLQKQLVVWIFNPAKSCRIQQLTYVFILVKVFCTSLLKFYYWTSLSVRSIPQTSEARKLRMKIAHEITHGNFKKYILKEYQKLKNKKKRGGFCAGSFNAAKIKKPTIIKWALQKARFIVKYVTELQI